MVCKTKGKNTNNDDSPVKKRVTDKMVLTLRRSIRHPTTQANTFNAVSLTLLESAGDMMQLSHVNASTTVGRP